MKGWISVGNGIWHYDMLGEDGLIETDKHGSVVYIKEKQHYFCTSTQTKKPKYTKRLDEAKKTVEGMLSR